jgi:hypothetical protein
MFAKRRPSKHLANGSCIVLLFAAGCSPPDLPANVVLSTCAIPTGYFVLAAARVGDVDRDGFDDTVVGRSADPRALVGGLASVYSLRTGKEVLRLRTDPASDFRFEVAASAGDVDADGWPDVLLADSSDPDEGKAGRVWLHSGRDGRLLRTWHGDSSTGWLSASVGTIGDVDGDGASDLWMHAPELFVSPSDDATQCTGPGRVRVHSGRTGDELYTIRGLAEGDALGETVAVGDDWDGDGTRDLVVGTGHWGASHYALVCSGRDGTVLRRLEPAGLDARYALAVTGCYDWNADGAQECLLTQPGKSYAVDPRDGHVLAEFEHQRSAPQLAGDWDGDGTSDLVLRDMETRGDIDPFEHWGNLARLHSGRTGRVLGERFFGPFFPFRSLQGLGDFDGDGTPDLWDAGASRVLSGKRFFELGR